MPNEFCNHCSGPYEAEWLQKYGGHWDTCPNRHAAVKATDVVNQPPHYTSGPQCECGRTIECIQITRHRTFNVGNAIKYLWRAGLKESAGKTAHAKQVEDLEKARWYITDEINRLKGNP